MYFWKCWRDTRTQFIVGVVVLVGVCSLFTIPVARLGTPDLAVAHVHPSIAQSWSSVGLWVLSFWGIMLTLVWGLVLGSAGLGKEFEKLTADFLLTRPRRRWYWVWVGWPVGVLELTIIVLAAVGATCGLLVYVTGHFYTWRMLAMIPGLGLDGAVAYGLSYFLSVVTRSGRRGLGYATGILLIAILFPDMAGHYWNTHIPSLWDLMGAICGWAAGDVHSFPVRAMILCTIIALAFPVASQIVVEHAQA